MGGQTLARTRRAPTHQKFFKGVGIDVGAGGDSIWNSRDLFPGIIDVRSWDLDDGDGALLDGVPINTYDFLHSSHSLEHMGDPKVAMDNWIRVVKPGGYISVIVPEFTMYEHGRWPSRFNHDHKHFFTEENIKELINSLKGVLLVYFQVITEGFDPDDKSDQTASGKAECAIEFVLKKL